MKIKFDIQVTKNDDGTFSARVKNSTANEQHNVKKVSLEEISERFLDMLEEVFETE